MRMTAIIALLPALAMAAPGQAAELEPGAPPTLFDLKGISFVKEVVVPGTPVESFDAFTGDVSGWWDHHLSEDPLQLRIEPWPGGMFREVFDDDGNGAIHAEVIHAKRGEILKLRGPFGFSGHALDLVHTFTFTAEGESTRVRLVLHGAGQLEEDWPAALSGVWDHFLAQYAGWVSSRRGSD